MDMQSEKKWKSFLKSGNFGRKVSKYRSLIPKTKFQNKIRSAAPSSVRGNTKKQKSWKQPPSFLASNAEQNEFESGFEHNKANEREESDQNELQIPVNIFEPDSEQLLESTFGFEYHETIDSKVSDENSFEKPTEISEPDLEQLLEVVSQNETASAIRNESCEQDLGTFLRDWSIKYNITHQALKPLLEKLAEYHRQLPVDPRRLLKTPRKTTVVESIDGGSYWHNSIGISSY